MTTAKHWTVEIDIDEHDRKTRAQARLRTRDDTHLVGVGLARCDPTDSDIPEIGDELATARALSDLAHHLLEASAADIEGVTRRPVHLPE